jgi:hypothetical protein
MAEDEEMMDVCEPPPIPPLPLPLFATYFTGNCILHVCNV